MTSLETLKRAAAEKAVEQVKSGMVVGLGTGSTTKYAIIKIGELWQAGQLTDIVGIPTSESTTALAGKYGLPLGTLVDYPQLDVAIDGADEVDPQLNLIKGLGGALLREKMIELRILDQRAQRQAIFPGQRGRAFGGGNANDVC